ncbi:hypothetical protein BG015_009691 [Linnemannia schmuckeri]|uniref:Uncharacterized protein n=1 Tax=Linnemannia schmuckeri TaxID=64567 RepID=A0A9P5VEL4_9FUNG|nr:hypothetical protein BG015_009691 [Linnemannia schmuckeri]
MASTLSTLELSQIDDFSVQGYLETGGSNAADSVFLAPSLCEFCSLVQELKFRTVLYQETPPALAMLIQGCSAVGLTKLTVRQSPWDEDLFSAIRRHAETLTELIFYEKSHPNDDEYEYEYDEGGSDGDEIRAMSDTNVVMGWYALNNQARSPACLQTLRALFEMLEPHKHVTTLRFNRHHRMPE